MAITATVTAGHTWVDDEEVTYVKLRDAAVPTVVLSGDPDAPEQNFLRNGNFITRSWITPSGITCTAGAGTQNAYYWKYRPTGANAAYRRSTSTPDVESLYAAEIEGATSVTTGDFYQEMPSDLAGAVRRQVTFSCRIYNETGAAFTPLLRINSADAIDDFGTTTNRYSQNLQECGNAAWTEVSKTLDLSALTDIGNGIEVVVQVPSGSLSSTSKKVRLSRMKLQGGAAVTDFVEDKHLLQEDFDTSGSTAVVDVRDVWLFK